MEKIVLYAAFSISTDDQFDVWLLKDLKLQGFSKVKQEGCWINSEGKVYKEPSYQYVFFGLNVDQFEAINKWFTRCTIEECLLWEQNNNGRFVDLRQNEGITKPWEGILADPAELLSVPAEA